MPKKPEISNEDERALFQETHRAVSELIEVANQELPGESDSLEELRALGNAANFYELWKSLKSVFVWGWVVPIVMTVLRTESYIELSSLPDSSLVSLGEILNPNELLGWCLILIIGLVITDNFKNRNEKDFGRRINNLTESFTGPLFSEVDPPAGADRVKRRLIHHTNNQVLEGFKVLNRNLKIGKRKRDAIENHQTDTRDTLVNFDFDEQGQDYQHKN